MSSRGRPNRWGQATTSRWGQNGNQQQRQQQQQPHRPSVSEKKEVSDADALLALLSSAEAREQERSQLDKSSGNNNNNNKRSRFDNNNNNNRQNNTDSNKKRRGGYDDDRRNNNNNNNNDSYYGPQHNNNKNNNNNDRDNAMGGDRDRLQQQQQQQQRRVVQDDNPDDGDRRKQDEDDDNEQERPPPEFKPNFGLSGALAKDDGIAGGNVYKGIVLKFREPPEARAPNTQWRFYVFKGKELLETLHISKQSAYLLGRNREIADIPLDHPSLSSQHAVLQYRALPLKKDNPLQVSCQPYILDLESTNGTFLNTVRIDSARYYQLKKGDVLTFGASKREYVLLTENTTSVK